MLSFFFNFEVLQSFSKFSQKQMNFSISYRIALSLILSIVLFMACEQPETSQTEQFESDLESFNQSMENLDETMALMDAMQEEIDQIERERAMGNINDVEAGRRLNEVKDNYGRVLSRRSNTNPATGLPSWARALGLTEPRGLTLDADYSQMTSASEPGEGFNSVLLVYSGNYDRAISEAKRIADMAGVPLSRDFKQAVELAETFSSAPIRGVAYMNFDPFVRDEDYNISITVDEEGMLTISAVDVRQMREQFERESSAEMDFPY